MWSPCSLRISQRPISTLLVLLIALVLLCAYKFHQPAARLVRTRCPNETPQSSQPVGPPEEADTSPISVPSQLPQGTCSMYGELRSVNFLHASIRRSLCKGVAAFSIVNGAFPVCDLRDQLPDVVTQPVKAASFASYVKNPSTGRNAPIHVYSTPDFISDAIRRDHAFEAGYVNTVMEIAKKLNAKSPVTFIDIGCNIGVFSVSALDLGLPVVALDANIRNLLRVRLSAQAMNKSNRLHLLWNFVNRRVSLMYLNFPQDCNIGGATKFDRAVADTIPVMSTTADSIVPSVGTQTVVMKVDIEGGEGEFFKSAAGLFSRFTIPAVHMEWLKRHMSEEERQFMIEFFINRKYSPRSTWDFRKRLNIEDANFNQDDLIWIREDYLSNGTFTIPVGV